MPLLPPWQPDVAVRVRWTARHERSRLPAGGTVPARERPPGGLLRLDGQSVRPHRIWGTVSGGRSARARLRRRSLRRSRTTPATCFGGRGRPMPFLLGTTGYPAPKPARHYEHAVGRRRGAAVGGGAIDWKMGTRSSGASGPLFTMVKSRSSEKRYVS